MILLAFSVSSTLLGQSNELIEKITGKWELKAISGGFTGIGEKIQFKTVLEIFNSNQYAIYRNDIRVESGTYALRKGILGSKIKLESEETSFDQVLTKESKTINVENSRLILMDPCCDMFTYHFELL